MAPRARHHGQLDPTAQLGALAAAQAAEHLEVGVAGAGEHQPRAPAGARAGPRVAAQGSAVSGPGAGASGDRAATPGATPGASGGRAATPGAAAGCPAAAGA